MEKNQNKAMGGYASQMVKRLKKSGLSGKQLDLAISAVKGETPKIKPIPRPIQKRIAEQIARNGRAVVVKGQNGFWKVYSLEGYGSVRESSKASAIDNKPWLKAGTEAATAAGETAS